jgi:hypothetical protein
MFLTRSHIAPGVSLFLSYLLVMLLCLPFATTVRANLSVAPVSVFHEQNIPEREGELLVRFRGGVSQRDKDTILATLGVKRVKELRGGSGFEKVELSGGRDVKTAALELLMKPQVEFAEPNFLISKSDITPNDAQFNEQWALRNTGQNGGEFGADINASGAWETAIGSPGPAGDERNQQCANVLRWRPSTWQEE